MSKAPKSAVQAERERKAKLKQEQKAARETAKAEQLEFLKLEVAENDDGMRSIGEHLLKALHYGATQREVAKVIDKAASWVNRVKKWAETGYAACGPFSADGKARRERDKAKSVLPAKQPGIGHNKPPSNKPAAAPKGACAKSMMFDAGSAGSQPVFRASAEKPLEQVQTEFTKLADEAEERDAFANKLLGPSIPPGADGGHSVLAVTLKALMNEALAHCEAEHNWQGLCATKEQRDAAIKDLCRLRELLVKIAAPKAVH